MVDASKAHDIQRRMLERLHGWWIDVESEEHRAVIDAAILFLSKRPLGWYVEHESLIDDDRELAMLVSWFTKD